MSEVVHLVREEGKYVLLERYAGISEEKQDIHGLGEVLLNVIAEFHDIIQENQRILPFDLEKYHKILTGTSGVHSVDGTAFL